MNQEIMCEVEIGTHMVEIDGDEQVGVKVRLVKKVNIILDIVYLLSNLFLLP